MLPDGSISAIHVWKRFRADPVRRSIRDRLDDPRGLVRRGPRWRWALREVELVAEPGDAIGLVGANGSGKSTLLKILSGVMYPYAGRLQVRGRVGALIEVRAGIHPQLTGRENIYLYGVLLGLSRREVARRFDAIIDFAELESAVDRQVKFYSSGMQMRLGFAVAAFLEPDVLLVDEVLAVGDTAFQQRCLDRMRQVLEQGTTLVYVSHDLPSVEAVCNRCLWLDEGVRRAEGPVNDVLAQYRTAVEEAAELAPHRSGAVRLVKIDADAPHGGSPATDEPLDISVLLEASEPRSATVCIGVSEGPASPIFLLHRDLHLGEGETRARCSIARLPLPRGRFYVWMGVFERGTRELFSWQPVAHLAVAGPELRRAPRGILRLSPVHVAARWDAD